MATSASLQGWLVEGFHCIAIHFLSSLITFVIFQDERIAHAATTAKLMKCEDKLEFAHGEIEILRKQLQREKRQFDET